MPNLLRGRGSGGLTISARSWGTVDGQSVDLYTLANGRMTVNITNYGGVVQSIWVPDRHGHAANVALGFPTLAGYVTDFTNPPSGGSGDTYFGAIVGRYANRIANHSFTLNSTTYDLPGNNGPNDINTMHGGPSAWNTKVWAATPEHGADFVALKLTYTDPDGYNGFPGTVQATVTYTLSHKDELKIQYGATTSKPTVINLTNHTYFNLAGEGSGDVYGQRLQINADRFTPVNDALIPMGQFASVAGTPFDFRQMTPIGRNIHRADMPEGQQLVIAHGFDHNWILDGSGMRLAAVAEDPASGRALKTYTTEPGVQFYSGNFLVGDLIGPSGRTYRQSDGFALETQHYPDAPHHIGQSGWPSVVLNPGQQFSSTTIYAFSTSGGGGHGHR
jgi:aldose 1-epimerase